MYCHIIGYPLNKPRSVKIWQNFFKKKKIKCKMSAKEVYPKKLSYVLKKFKLDKNFLASAVTMPFKSKVVKYVKFGDKISMYSNSINLIIKKKKLLLGFNTDVMGALDSIKNVKKKNIMIFGIGGTGKAILRVFLKIYKNTNFIIVSSRNHREFSSHKRVVERKKLFIEDIKKIDLFINCSPLGSDLKKKFVNKSSLSLNHISYLKKSATIFDLVYKPLVTKLQKNSKVFKIKYINGLKMNTVQANVALKIILKNIN